MQPLYRHILWGIEMTDPQFETNYVDLAGGAHLKQKELSLGH
jgi:hypothetical protein